MADTEHFGHRAGWGGYGPYLVAIWTVVVLAFGGFVWVAVHYDGPFIMPPLATTPYALVASVLTWDTHRRFRRG